MPDILDFDAFEDQTDDLGLAGSEFLGEDLQQDLSHENIGFDVNSDGIPDVVSHSIDIDGDGVTDIQSIAADTDGDGVIDFEHLAVDIDGDGVADIEEMAVDLDGDGNIDIFGYSNAAEDVWGDASFEEESSPDFDSPIEALAGEYYDLTFDGYNEYYSLHGTPSEDMALWDPQDKPMSCAVATTSMMLRSVGIDSVNEEQLSNILEKLMVYDPERGTNPEVLDDAINIIASNAGLPIEATDFHGASVDDYRSMLDNGIRPLLAVDATELQADYATRRLNDLGILESAPHAVQLTAIEHTPDGDFAVINDPGESDGAGMRIPLENLLDAAEDHGFSGVAVCRDDATAYLPSHEVGVQADASANSMLGSVFGRQPVHQDIWGNMYRGDSLFPFAGPNA